MPHCILEYTDNIKDSPDYTELLKNLHQFLLDTGLFKLNDIKSRVIRHDIYRIGDGDPRRAFVTLNIQIMDGRSDQVKTNIATKAAELLKRYYPESFKNNLFNLTVQVTDIHRPSYTRLLSE